MVKSGSVRENADGRLETPTGALPDNLIIVFVSNNIAAAVVVPLKRNSLHRIIHHVLTAFKKYIASNRESSEERKKTCTEKKTEFHRCRRSASLSRFKRFFVCALCVSRMRIYLHVVRIASQ